MPQTKAELVSIREITFPKQATVKYIDFFLNGIRKADEIEDSELVLDFSETTEVSALSVCFLCGLIDLAEEKNNRVKIILPRNRRAADSLRKVKVLADAPGPPKIKIAQKMLQVRRIDGNNNAFLEEMLESLSYNIDIPIVAKTSLTIILTELLTNAIDHSGQSFCYVCVGAWGKSKNFHVAFLDFGVGMPQKIRTRFSKYKRDEEAIKAILSEGLTTRVGLVGGLGYKHIQNILKINGGRLHIFSGEAKVVMKYDKREYNYKRAREQFVGTCIDIQYNLKGPGFYEIMGETTGDYF